MSEHGVRQVCKTQGKAPELSVVMIAYNEEACLEQVVQELRADLNMAKIDFELLLIDDGSADSSLQLMEHLADERTQVWTQNNGGIGAALSTGYEAARGRYATWVPADGQIAPSSVIALFEQRKEASMVTTVYRHRDDPFFRMLISRSLNTLVRLRTGEWKKSGGNYIFERSAWEAHGPREERSMIISELFRQRLVQAGLPVIEIIIDARARVAGHSKVLNPRAILRTLKGLLGMVRS